MVWHVKNTRLFIEMKRILFIAPASFPVTGAENIVNIKLLQALSKSGDFEIDLVSKKSKWENYPSESISTYAVNLESLNVVEVDNRINVRTCVGHLLAFFILV